MSDSPSLVGSRLNTAVTIDTIDRELASGFHSLRFSRDLEHLFQMDQLDARVVYTA